MINDKIKLKPRGKPRGRPFTAGPEITPRRNPGGKPFIKIHQKLSVIAAEELSSPADPELRALVGAPSNATNGSCVVRAMIIEAVSEKSVAAANFLFQCTEAAKVRVDLNETKDITFRVEQEAREVLGKLLGEADNERHAPKVAHFETIDMSSALDRA